jgi:EcoEI R protein C-terminal
VAAFTVTEREYLDSFSPQARRILSTLLDKYAAHGVNDLSAQGVQGPPLNEMGSVVELAEAFEGRRSSTRPSTSWGVACSRPARLSTSN